MKALQAFAKDSCLAEEMPVPNGVKPSLCVYTGFFMLRFLLSKAQNAPNQVQPLIDDYCANHASSIHSRTEIVQNLRESFKLKAEDEYLKECAELISKA